MTSAPNARVAVLLVAGVGSRLRPLTDDRPKALVEVGGASILARAVASLVAHGVERLVLATGYREAAVRAALERAPVPVEYFPNPRYASTQNSVSLALCRDGVRGEAFYKLDGDVVFRPEVLARLDAARAPLAVAVDRTRALDAEAMKVRLEGERIAAFGKGIPLEQSAGETIGIERLDAAAGALVFDELARAAARGETELYYEDVYSRLVAAGALTASPVDVGDLPWTEIDDPSDLERARALV
ncbi:MAG: phosphocholine cytidylyltransferase family protein [Sorangiineae bacterium]|nr:phosphocholine cytidylyltransferase family protein [Polyangiaceae bacterium]MEB2323956.1 phosphocholine cytidylyltransferase family protein [Sorangiineae bacterium]